LRVSVNGRVIAEHDVQERDDRDGHDRRDAAARQEVERGRQPREPFPEQVGDRVLRHVPEQNRGDGDAELGGRELAI